MTIHTNRWRPDTCNCVIEYQFDDNDQEDPAKFGPLTNHKVLHCKEHQQISDAKDVYEEVLDENQTKNNVLASIQQRKPELFDEQNQPKAEIQWAFTNKRDLEVSIRGIKDSEKVTLSNNILGAIGVLAQKAARRKVTIK